MIQLVPDIKNTSVLVQEISVASLEQNNGVAQVNMAIQQLNTVTQQNAAASEELSSSSEELASQAEQLRELVSFYKTGTNYAAGSKVKHSLAQPAKRQFSSTKQAPVKYNMPNANLPEIKLTDSSDANFESF